MSERISDERLADIAEHVEEHGLLKSMTRDVAQSLIAELRSHRDREQQLREEREAVRECMKACVKLDELDWCAGYELVGHNQEILQDALDTARCAIHDPRLAALKEGAKQG